MVPEEVINDYSGMIDKNTANKIASGNNKYSASSLLSNTISVDSIVDVEDYVIRLFNKRVFNRNQQTHNVRHGVLGNGTNFVRLVLWDNFADLVDKIPIERGDKVLIKFLRVKNSEKGIELHSTKSTSIYRREPHPFGIDDFSNLKDGEISDIIGSITSIGSLKYFDRDGKQRNVVDCEITDKNQNKMKLVMWDSSALLTSEINIGTTVKIEFAKVKKINDQLEIHASDKSRVIINYKI